MTKDTSPFGPLDTDAARQQEERLRKLARETMPDLPKRFYETVAIDEAGADADFAFRITLDGRPVRTPAKRILAVPDRTLAGRVAEEWSAQETLIDPRKMPLTRLANVVLDGVVDQPHLLREEIANYAMNDLVCYRADGPEGLIALQGEHWDCAVGWAERELGARPVLATGIMPVDQPERLRTRLVARLDSVSAFSLAALHVLTTMTGSALLAVMLADREIDEEALWVAAHVDEDWQILQWGEDAEAQARRIKRRVEFDAACVVLKACG